MTQQYACPVDGTALAMSERHGIEIDYCPVCRGVWLDRGELDKIVEQSARQQEYAAPVEQVGPWTTQSGYADRRDRPHGYRPHKRRKSFLEELFD